MTNPTDYHTAIDEQLLAVALAKSDGSSALPQEIEATRVKLEEIAHAAAMNKLQQSVAHHQRVDQAAQQAAQAQLHQLQQQQQQQHHQQQQQQHHHQHHQQQHQHQFDDDPSQYNIQIPDPIIDAKLRIYPVSENTITAEGNLITRPYPEQVFQSRDDLNEFIHEFARDNGFGVVIAHSNKKAIYYTCELGGRYRHKKSKKNANGVHLESGNDGVDAEDLGADVTDENGYLLDPSTKTKKLRCPFSMTANFKKSTGVWTLRTTCNEHNHPQLDPLSNHPMLRKRSDELNLLILDLYKIGTKPLHIESKIKDQYPDVLIKREDIYNEIRGYKRKLKKQNRFLTSTNSRHSLYNNNPNAKKRSNASSFQQVGLDDDDDQGDQVLDYDLHQTHQDVELQRQLAAASQQLQHQQLQLQQQHHQQHHHHQPQLHHQHHIDEQQLQQYLQQLQEHDLHHGGGDPDSDNTAAAAIAAVASASQQHQTHSHHHDSELSMDNIDSRLVGE